MSVSKQVCRRRIGRVTIYQRGGRYWIYYRQGKPIRRAVGSDREAALTLAAKINGQLAEGGPTALSFSFQPISIEPLVAAWLEHRAYLR